MKEGAERFCRVCADRILLRSKSSWLDLRSMDTISALQLDTMPVVTLSQNRNLPSSLHRIASHNLSVRLEIQDSLYTASRLGRTRCLLLQEDGKYRLETSFITNGLISVEADASVSVWADSRAIVKGAAGARTLEACLESWTHFDGILLPFIKCMLIAAVFAHIVPDFSQSDLDLPDTANAATIAQQRAESTDFDNVWKQGKHRR